MDELRRVLARNLNALMQHDIDRNGPADSYSALARRAKIGKATVWRLMNPAEAEAKTGKPSPLPAVDTLDRLARAFGLRAWQLLSEALVPGSPLEILTPATRALILTPELREEIEELRALRAIVTKAAQHDGRHHAGTGSDGTDLPAPGEATGTQPTQPRNAKRRTRRAPH